MGLERKTWKIESWVLSIVLFFLGCSGSGLSDKSFDNDGPVVLVNGEAIKGKQFERELKLQRKKYKIDPDKPIDPEQLRVLKAKTLNEMIQSVLFEQEAVRNDIYLSSDEFNRMMEEIKNDYHEEISLKKIFQIEGVDQKDWENKLRKYMLTEKLFEKVIENNVILSESALRSYFDKHPEDFRKAERVRALHIMVATEEDAQKIRKKLESRVEKFSSLALKYSLGPEGIRGGDLGYFEAGQMPEEFDGVFKLKVNRVSDVIQTPYGYHILKVIDKKPARDMEYKEARKMIHGKLSRKKREQAFQVWLHEVRSRAKIEINDNIVNGIG
tara:strand:+ start:944 stop:1924 length:981 start_codon:yes stop_codon:yes gene_type:complete